MSQPSSGSSSKAAPRRYYAFGFSPWKRRIIRRFVTGRLRFVYWGRQIPPHAEVLIWGTRPAPAHAPASIHLTRLEDGFIRSVGLGADLIPPLSWVLDRTGMYYDATRPSDLENLLNSADFDDALLARAEQLRVALVSSGLTKYNVGTTPWQRPSGSKRVLLVVGQVESDASIRLGGVDIRTNQALLDTVRTANPDAYLIYKPHPDVVAGLRKQGRLDASTCCDEVVTDVAMHTLIQAVDEVHVITSLAGFEALLRDKPVYCYGQPFYAGWGLTQDRHPHPRRTRPRSLQELIAASLILYPRYVSRQTHQQISPEAALDELIAWRNNARESIPMLRHILRLLLSRP